jgi:hypothetical protein
MVLREAENKGAFEKPYQPPNVGDQARGVAAVTAEGRKSRVIDAIRNAFPVLEAPGLIFRHEVPQDEFYTDILDAVRSRKWNEISMSDWRGTGVGINTVRSFVTEQAFSYFLPGIMISGLESDDPEYAIGALLPNNQRWEPGGARWDAFIATFDAKQRAAIRVFLDYVVQTSPEGDSLRAAAEHALWYKFYD